MKYILIDLCNVLFFRWLFMYIYVWIISICDIQIENTIKVSATHCILFAFFFISFQRKRIVITFWLHVSLTVPTNLGENVTKKTSTSSADLLLFFFLFCRFLHTFFYCFSSVYIILNYVFPSSVCLSVCRRFFLLSFLCWLATIISF
jgi:hypothetical protein